MKKEEKLEIIRGIMSSEGLSAEAKLEAINLITNPDKSGDLNFLFKNGGQHGFASIISDKKVTI